ncbi:MAG TPA: hypothetical protein PKD50_19165, partial [Leptospiraceae bacterium]|nr:hypothetical protein [Leptospiraceae bacterium]
RRLPKKGQQGERINKPSDYKGYALRFLDGAKQNHNAALIPIPKTEIQKESKSIFYNTYLHGMGSFLTEANKEKVYYRLANYSFST